MECLIFRGEIKYDKLNPLTLTHPGIVTESTDGTIIIENVPIVTPNCDVVVPSLNFTVKPQMHLLITGRVFVVVCMRACPHVCTTCMCACSWVCVPD